MWNIVNNELLCLEIFNNSNAFYLGKKSKKDFEIFKTIIFLFQV